MKPMPKILLAALMLGLSACEQAPQAYRPEPFAFETNRAAPIGIRVAEIKVVEDYHSPLRRPNVEQDFPVPPAVAVGKWVNQRLKATGTSGVMEVVINDASVKEIPLKKTGGIKGVFTDDQDARYEAKLSVTFRVFTGAQAISDATGDVIVTRNHTINEKATVFQREAMYHGMTRDMMTTFDSEAQARLRQYFSPYLR